MSNPTRQLLLAVALAAGSLVAVTPQAPQVPELATTAPKERPKPPRAGRSLERLPLRAVRTPPRPQRQPSRVMAVTMYCYTGSRNAAGKWPTVGTAAANAYPLGTRLHVEGVGVVTVEDRSAPGATDVDLYGGNDAGCEARAVEWGRRYLEVREAA